MDNQLFTVVLQFDAQDPVMRQKVMDGLSRIDPTVPKRLANITHGRIIVKKNTRLATAKRLVRALTTTGATCRVLKQTAAKPHVTPAIAAQEPGNTSPPLIRCPNCTHEQPPTVECRACGVIIEKSRQHHQKKRPLPPAMPKAPAKPVQTAPLAELRRRIGATLSVWSKKRPFKREIVQNWWKRLTDRLLSCAVVFIVALVLEFALLYAAKVMWFVYSATSVGEYYARHFPEKANAIGQVLAMDLLLLSWGCTLTVLFASLVVSVSAQFLHLIRLLFDNQGLPVKALFWCAPVTALAAWGTVQRYDLLLFVQAFCLVLLPTVCILSSCMQMARDTVPEMGSIWRKVTNAIGNGDGRPFTKIKCRLCEWIDANF